MKVYLGTLDRFGYELEVICDSEAKVVKVLMAEYRRAYKNINNISPSKEEITNAKDDIEIWDMELDKIIWR